MIIAKKKDIAMPTSIKISLYPKKYIIEIGINKANTDCILVREIILIGNIFA